MPTVECPGCGLVLPAAPRTDVVQSINSSDECATVRSEILGFQFEHPVMLRYHQMIVDAYGAQHGGGPTPPIRVAYGLAGLWLAIEHGFSGEDVRAVHRRMGHPQHDWPAFVPPAAPVGWATIDEVADAGVRAGSQAGHARAVRGWAESVWDTWVREVPGTDDAVESMLRGIFVSREPALHGTIGAASAEHRLRGLLEA